MLNNALLPTVLSLMFWGVTYYLYPEPGFYSVAIFTAIGDNFTAMFTYY